MKEPLNVAVIGFGRMGQIYARTIADHIDGAALYAVVDPVLREEALDGLAVPHVLEEAAEALALPDLHAVVIATPTSTHRDLVTAAARAGKAIFCEKPLALTLDDTHEALAAVEKAGVLLQVGFMRRFDTSYREMQHTIEAGRIGRPLTFKAVGRDLSCPDPAFADPAHSGGLILDMGIHDFDLARWLMGSEVEHVSAEGSLLACEELRAVGDIDNAVVNLRFENGALGNVELSRNAVYGYDVRTEVMGTEGVARVGGERAARFTLLRDESDFSDENYLTQRFGDAYRAQIHHFVECIRQDREPRATGADALAAFEVGLAATFAARTGKPVTLEAVRSGWKPELAST